MREIRQKNTTHAMKTFLPERCLSSFLTCTAAAALFLSASCTSEPVTQAPDPEFAADEMTGNVPAEGGTFSVTYTLDNPAADGEFSIFCEDGSEWLYNFSAFEGTISFEAEANASADPRTTTVSVVYMYGGKSLSDSFDVVQEGGQAPALDCTFGFSFTSISEMSASVQVTPSADDVTYVSMFVEKSFYDGLGGTDKALFDEVMRMYGEAAQSQGKTLEEYLSSGKVLVSGKSEVSLSGMKTDTEYYVFAVGTSTKGQMTTGLSKMLFKTKAVDFIQMSFSMNISVDGPVAYMTVLPDNLVQRYVFDVVKAGSIDKQDILDAYQQFINQTIKSYQQFGFTVEQAVVQISSQGYVYDFRMELDPEYEYYGFATAIREDGLLISEPVVIDFTTESVVPSDNEISISVTSLRARDAEYSVSVSNDDPYIVVTGKQSDWEGKSDEEIMNSILGQDFPPEPSTGPVTGKMEALSPETEYVILAFGTVAGYPTTDLVRCSFTTPEAKLADIEFSLVIDKYFDGDEVEKVWPDLYPYMSGRAVVPVTAATVGDNLAGYHYHVFYGDLTDPQASDYPTDEYIYSSLLNQGYTGPGTTFYLDYDRDFTFVGFARDKDNNYGPVYREVFRFTRDGVSPVDEFVPMSAGAASGACRHE